MAENYFQKLYDVDVTGKVEQKNGLSYLSWASAWAEVKKVYPTATYTIYETPTGVIYHNDGKTAWVKTGVTIEEIEHIEYLPIMDFRNKSIPVDNITSSDVNKSIQRSLTKACARHGLGLFIYEGEDIPESVAENQKKDAELKEINAESFKIVLEKSKVSEDMKNKVADICGQFVESKNPKEIKDLDKANELNKLLKKLK